MERQHNIINLLNLTVLTLLCVLTYSMHMEPPASFSWVPSVRLYAILLAAYQICVVYKRNIWFFDVSVIFTILNYLFVLSYLFIWEEGMDRYPYWTMGFTSEQWLNAFCYGMCYVHAMFTGLIWAKERKHEVSKEKRDYLNSKYDSHTLYRIGLIIFVLTLPAKLYVDALTYVVNRSGTGYSAVLTNDQVSGVVFNLSMLVNVGIIYIICSRHLPKKKAVWFFLIYYIYAFGITTLVGGRRFTVTACLATIPALFHAYDIKIKKRDFIRFGIVAYLGLVFLQTISATREATVNDFSEYLSLATKYLSGADIIFDTFYEFGNTVFPYIMSIIVYPEMHDYFYGTTLLFIWVLAIPGAGKLFPNLSHDYGTSTYAIKNFNYWFGGAFGQELYANFGYYAILISVVIAYYINKIMGGLNSRCNIIHARYFSLFYVLLNLIRSDMFQFVRLSTWSYFIPILICYIIKKK